MVGGQAQAYAALRDLTYNQLMERLVTSSHPDHGPLAHAPLRFVWARLTRSPGCRATAGLLRGVPIAVNLYRHYCAE
jgi:hypothetical protein